MPLGHITHVWTTKQIKPIDIFICEAYYPLITHTKRFQTLNHLFNGFKTMKNSL